MKPQSSYNTGLEEVLLLSRLLSPIRAREMHDCLEYLELPSSRPEGRQAAFDHSLLHPGERPI